MTHTRQWLVVWSLLWTHASHISAASCPYGDLPSNFDAILVSDKAYCPTSALSCIVNKTCKYIGTSETANWNAIGNYSDLPSTQTSWAFKGGADCINVKYAAFPSQVTSLKLTNMTFPPGDIAPSSWSTSLEQLFIENTNITTIPRALPPPLKLLFLGFNYLSDQTELQALPNSITQLSLEGNRYSSLSNLDWSRMTQVYLSKNVYLRNLSNITFSTAIKNLNLENLTIQSWTMGTSTFKALNSSLQPNNTAEDSTRTDGSKSYTGYNYYGLKITTSAAECASRNGKLQELWPDKSQRNFKYSQEVFTVCVLQDGSSLDTDPSPADGLSTEAVVGIAAAAGVLFLGLIAFLWLRRRRQTSADKSSYDQVKSPTSISSHKKIEGLMQPLQLVQIADEDIQVGKQIGTGAFAGVFLGNFQGQTVAVKKLHRNRVEVVHIQSFIDEIILMSQFDSPHVVNLIGAAWTRPDDLKCIMEYMDNGDLKSYLEKQSPEAFPWREKFVHILSVVEGLCYLHSMSVIHRDIKSRNVLLDSKKGTKLTDFGVSKEDLQQTMTVGVGTFRWMAPEVLTDKGYTVAADIYSYGAAIHMDLSDKAVVGVLLSEFDTHKTPYEELKNPTTGQPIADSAIILKVVAGTIRPSFTPECPEWIHELAMQCLLQDPEDRPTAMQISHIVRTKLRELSDKMFSL